LASETEKNRKAIFLDFSNQILPPPKKITLYFTGS
jgi:hypothetical protein